MNQLNHRLTYYFIIDGDQEVKITTKKKKEERQSKAPLQLNHLERDTYAHVQDHNSVRVRVDSIRFGGWVFVFRIIS